MYSKIIEATNGPESSPLNWGKFMVLRPEFELHLGSALPGAGNLPLLRSLGWTPEHIIVFDLQTCEGAAFWHKGYAPADLAKHRIWVCPLFEPFLVWLYMQLSHGTVLDALPDYIHLPDAPFALSGYRRSGQ